MVNASATRPKGSRFDSPWTPHCLLQFQLQWTCRVSLSVCKYYFWTLCCTALNWTELNWTDLNYVSQWRLWNELWLHSNLHSAPLSMWVQAIAVLHYGTGSELYTDIRFCNGGLIMVSTEAYWTRKSTLLGKCSLTFKLCHSENSQFYNVFGTLLKHIDYELNVVSTISMFSRSIRFILLNQFS